MSEKRPNMRVQPSKERNDIGLMIHRVEIHQNLQIWRLSYVMQIMCAAMGPVVLSPRGGRPAGLDCRKLDIKLGKCLP